MSISRGPFLIGDLARRTGFSTKTIRYYETLGLMPRAVRRPSGYRAYEDAAVARLDLIARAKRLGLSLDEIRGVLELRDAGTTPCEHVLALLDTHLARVDGALGQLATFRRQLAQLRADARRRRRVGGGRICRIIEHAAMETSALDLPALARRASSPEGKR